MRRLLTYLTACALVFASLGIGLFTADLPFWRRAFAWPPQHAGIYLPAAEIGAGARDPGGQPQLDPSVDSRIVEEAVRLARDAGSRALLVMHRGRMQVERYFGADDATSLMPAGLLARPLAAMAVGAALGEGRVDSLDSPVARYLEEWEGDARGSITLRQLLEDTSGLESGGADARELLDETAWKDPSRLARFATSRGVRLLLGNDLESTALGFKLEHEPGGFHIESPVNAQLIAILLERATGMPYEQYLEERVWRPTGAGLARLQLDRRAGMPAAHCCWLAAPRDVLRVAGLLANDGAIDAARVLPEGWAATMAAPSRVDARIGMQLTRIVFDGADFLRAADAHGSAFWVAPALGLVIVDIAGEGGLSTPEVPKLLMRAFGASQSAG
jgi:CubicO group peptidase (beta-lactamase class C family)